VAFLGIPDHHRTSKLHGINERLGNKCPPRSLKQASLQISSSPATSHPYYWAAFAVFGSA